MTAQTASSPPVAESPAGGIETPDAQVRRTGRRVSRWLIHRLAPVALLVIVMTAGWQLTATLVDSPYMPSMGPVFSRLGDIVSGGQLWEQLRVTLERVVEGFAAAFVLSVGLGLAMGRNEWFRRFLEPAVLIGLASPGMVEALLCVVWFGIAVWNPIVTVALAATPALVLNITQGVRGVDPGLIEMAHVYRFSRRQRVRYLWLPALAPALFSGARLGIGLSWKIIVLVEIFGMSNGVGYTIYNDFGQQDVEGVLAWTVAFTAVMAVVEYGFLQTLERRALRWRREATV